MKAIKICDKNLSALQLQLDAVQKRCTVRTLDAADVVRVLDEYTRRLDIPKKALDGARGHFDPHAQVFPNSYKYAPESTHFRAEYRRGAWYVTEISRDPCGRPCSRENVILPPAACAAYLSHVCDVNYSGADIRRNRDDVDSMYHAVKMLRDSLHPTGDYDEYIAADVAFMVLEWIRGGENDFSREMEKRRGK